MDIFDSKGIKPMLISEQVEPYDDPDSIFELKLDGIRTLAYCDTSSVDLRNKRDMKLLSRFPELSDLYKWCQQKCILDGELIVSIDGKPDFYELQKRTLLGDPFKIQLANTRHPASFVVYDILYYKNKEVSMLPLLQRKQILEDAVKESNILSVSRYIETDGSVLFHLAKQQNLEGVVGKKKNSLYWYGKRTKEWNKIKVMADDDFVCIGYIPKSKGMISLILSKYENGSLVMSGHVTLGVTMAKLKQNGIKKSSCPLQSVPKGHEDAVWIEPMVCTIEYMAFREKGMAQAAFKYFRDDKLPEECI